MVAVGIPAAGSRSHGCGGVAASVARDFLTVHGHFLTGACARPHFRGDFPAVGGGRSNVDAGCAIVGGDFSAVGGDSLGVNGGGLAVNSDRHLTLTLSPFEAERESFADGD
ncbi:MAG: hypothetical protein EXS31_03085 [Pedosphaera sp.]|nr:hypothetical protein [Pedosphaera sp.]